MIPRTVLRKVTLRALITALVVGPVLTLINQYEALTGPAPLDPTKIALTMAVPFLVAFVSGYLTARSFLAQIADERLAAQAREAALTSQLAAAEATAAMPSTAKAEVASRD
ncbi:MAG: hypothetical protein AAGF44_04115 [Pseudomonadota bacterium]